MKITITVEGYETAVVELKPNALTEARNGDVPSPYARFFDDSSPMWTRDSESNLRFLKHNQNYANDLLKSRGHLFLNDVYQLLGIPKTRAGQVVGWIYDPENGEGDNHVDFGIYHDDQHSRDFVNGYEKSILLDFNVDGEILNMLEES